MPVNQTPPSEKTRSRNTRPAPSSPQVEPLTGIPMASPSVAIGRQSAYRVARMALMKRMEGK